MIINGNSKRILFKELIGDNYGIKEIEQNSIHSMVDLGAAYGTISILSRLMHPQMKIVAVEPHAITYRSLCENIKNMDILSLNAAYGTGADFYLEKERKMLLCNHFTHIPSNSRKIKSVTLSEIVSRFKLDPDSLTIKMDTEGAEWYIFDNISDIQILKKSKLFAAEIHAKTIDRNINTFFTNIAKLFEDSHTLTITKTASCLGMVKAIIKE